MAPFFPTPEMQLRVLCFQLGSPHHSSGEFSQPTQKLPDTAFPTPGHFPFSGDLRWECQSSSVQAGEGKRVWAVQHHCCSGNWGGSECVWRWEGSASSGRRGAAVRVGVWPEIWKRWRRGASSGSRWVLSSKLPATLAWVGTVSHSPAPVQFMAGLRWVCGRFPYLHWLNVELFVFYLLQLLVYFLLHVCAISKFCLKPLLIAIEMLIVRSHR